MHGTGWANIELRPFEESKSEQERLNQEKKVKMLEKDLKFTTAEEYMKRDLED